MNPSNPLNSITPTVAADLLYVLARSQVPLTGYAIEQAAGRAHAGVLKELARLVQEGILGSEVVGNATRYWLDREHLLAGPLVEAAGAMDRLENRIAILAAQMQPAPVAVLLFGSFARRDGNSSSDVDLFVVRPEAVAADDPLWLRSRTALARGAEAASGNPCQMMDGTPAQLTEGAVAGEELVASLQADAVCLFGSAPASLRRPGLAGALR